MQLRSLMKKEPANNLEQRITAIEARNQKVEADKDWETSWIRRLSIAVLTYAIIVVYLSIINNNAPFINALVPSIGFLLSTLVMGRVRSFWQKNRKPIVK
jgi:peptidoglycan/LPS O-acetylase OafA/YrhL